MASYYLFILEFHFQFQSSFELKAFYLGAISTTMPFLATILISSFLTLLFYHSLPFPFASSTEAT